MDVKYKHGFIVRDGNIIWDDETMFSLKKQMLEGKRGYAILEEEPEPITPDQYAYYFGVLIRKYCMSSNAFFGLTDWEIHNILLQELRSDTITYAAKDGKRKMSQITEDFKKFGKKRMRLYVEEVIAHLQVEYDIHPLPSEHFKDPKFNLNP